MEYHEKAKAGDILKMCKDEEREADGETDWGR